MARTRGQEALRDEATLVGLDIFGDAEVIKMMKRAPKKMRPVLRAAMHASVLHVKGEIQDGLSGEVLNKRTGNYYRSIKTNVRQHQSGNAYMGVVGVGRNVPYARIHEFGGEIRPRDDTPGEKLTFQIDGQWVSVYSVEIPARPLWEPTLVKTRGRVQELHRQAINRFFREEGKAQRAVVRRKTRRDTGGAPS